MLHWAGEWDCTRTLPSSPCTGFRASLFPLQVILTIVPVCVSLSLHNWTASWEAPVYPSQETGSISNKYSRSSGLLFVTPTKPLSHPIRFSISFQSCSSSFSITLVPAAKEVFWAHQSLAVTHSPLLHQTAFSWWARQPICKPYGASWRAGYKTWQTLSPEAICKENE